MATPVPLLDRILGVSTADALQESLGMLEDARAQNFALSLQAEQLQENMHELVLFMEDYQWIPIEGYDKEEGFPLKVLKEQASRAQALLAANPIVKRAVEARISYVWGNEFQITGDNIQRILNDENNQRTIFGSVAREVLERAAATDGNIFALRDNASNEVNLVPFEEIIGHVSDPRFKTKITHFLTEYEVKTTDFRTGKEKIDTKKTFYPTQYAVKKPTTISGIEVDNSKTMIHVAVNRQSTWVYGVGDILAAMFWVRGHKELFEDGKTFVKAQGRFASKVIARTQQGATNAAATVASQPRRDEFTGQPLDIGGTAVLGGGLDMQLMGKMGGGVDFRAFEPVLGLVAAGFSVPLKVLTAEADDSVSLENSVSQTMKGRQRFWGDFYKSIFGKKKVEVVWPPIASEPTHRQIQALEVVNNTGVLHREELRALALAAFGLLGDPNDLPPIKENPQIYIPIAVQQDAAKSAADAATKAADVAAKSAVVGDQGVTGKVGDTTTGDHTLRDEGGQAHTDVTGKK